jgi:hypothetical protein
VEVIMARTLKSAVAAGMVAAALLAPEQSHAQEDFPAAAFGVNWGVQAVSLPDVAGLVENVPAQLRRVPSHPGDTWIYGSRPVVRTIPFDSIEPNPVSFLTSLHFAAELTVRRFRLRGGPAFAVFPRIDQGLVKANTGATREVNQWGEPYRGSATSLVYYNMYPETSAAPGWLIEGALSLNRHVSAFGGMGQDNVRLLVESGYDRFDSLETYGRQGAGVVHIRRVHGGLDVQLPIERFHSAGLRVSAGQIRTPITVHDMTVGAAGSLYLAVGLSVHHVLVTRD